MTLDLDELERKAKVACSEVVGPLECTDLGMERVADLEFIAAVRAAGGGWKPGSMYGAPLVLALIERVRDAEAEKAADAERAEYWRVEANRVHAEALAKANARIRQLGAVLAAIRDDGLSRDDARDEARKALNA